ncbi:MAG: hypothetical protein NDI77_06560 [Geobacteraceae bacterium]|nr:hypothetical protein [Geobacteraceae bacterium]
MIRKLLPSGMLILLIAPLLAVPAAAQEEVRKVKPAQPALKVIEEKCLVCHNRKRIDEAVQERKDLEKILRRMEQKGVVLTESERRVMGHFWPQQPLKGKKGETPPPEKKGAGFPR